MIKKLKALFVLIILLFFMIIFFASLLYLYEKKNEIKFKVFNFLNIPYGQETDYAYVSKEDEYWAKEIMNGGYILHFRHAERDKWIDVAMYDALESDVHNNGADEPLC